MFNQTALNLSLQQKADLSANIFRLVSTVYQVPTASIQGPTTERESTQPRQVCCFLLTECGFLLTECAEAICRKDHGTVIHSLKRVKNLRDTCLNFAALLRILQKETHSLAQDITNS